MTGGVKIAPSGNPPAPVGPVLPRRPARLAFGMLLVMALAAGNGQAQQVRPVGPEEIAIGRTDAPLTLIEYTSLTCAHCKAFHQFIFPELKKTLIDSGQVRYVFREVPQDERAMAAALLVRCQPRERYVESVNTLFANSDKWWATASPLLSLRTLATGFGMDPPAFEACLKNQPAFEAISSSRSAARGDGVTSVPTFVVGARRHVGNATLVEIERLIAASRNRDP